MMSQRVDARPSKRNLETLWMLLATALVSALIIIPGLLWAFSEQNKEIAASRVEWGAPLVISITDRGPLVHWGVDALPGQNVTLRYSSDITLTVKMDDQDAKRPTANVWHNTHTDAFFVGGDLDNQTAEPYHPNGRWALILLGTFFAVIIAEIGLMVLIAWLEGRSSQH